MSRDPNAGNTTIPAIDSRSIVLSAFADNFCKLLNWTLPHQDFRSRSHRRNACSGSDDAKKHSKLHCFRCRICRPLRRVVMDSTTYLLTDQYTTSAKASKKARKRPGNGLKTADSPLLSGFFKPVLSRLYAPKRAQPKLTSRRCGRPSRSASSARDRPPACSDSAGSEGAAPGCHPFCDGHPEGRSLCAVPP